MIGHGDAGERRRDEVRALVDERVVQAPGVQRRQQDGQEVLVHRDAEQRDVDVDLTHFLEAHDLRAAARDLVRQGFGAQRVGRPSHDSNRLEQRRDVVRGIERAQRLDDDVHIRPDVEVTGHHGNALSAGARHAGTGDADAARRHRGEGSVLGARGHDREQCEQGPADAGIHGRLRGASGERERTARSVGR